MNILIFGKDGQLGKAFRTLIDSTSLSKDHQIQYVGRDDCDLSQVEKVRTLLSAAKPDLIINAAAYTAVDKAETEVELANAINARAPEAMAQYAAAHGAIFLHYSTDYVFDGSKAGFYTEDDARNPLGAYGKSKATGEEAIEKAFSNTTQGQYAIFRTSWVYGTGSNFIRTILRLAKERDELKVIQDQLGVPTSADWLAKLSLDLALNQSGELRKFDSGIYHAVPPGESNWHALACLAVEAASDAGISLKSASGAIKPIKAVEYPLPAPRPMNSRMATDKLRQAIKATGDVSKLQQWNKPWSDDVWAYVQQLAKDGLI
ncbi:dTDP-4-dehydrorhamnose reductase [Polynucleobacter sp. AP-Latsch-80-C2]|jgi:dTDP-4-dehydrorhamnose reductase|uniref:dTDP-4-dehydrorhamnose reductase n=1 Tax=Polynucleobacter sp. AP-Latsch-80-C2 TaxID=2576931 RepID=UPI001C0B2176|nr:dTDP-4-dehydrorhamnose reductase [Polynucleobacter sp. AP-Latsch-80-C2]MBU3623262.1 dTDP-4-dehydrorhamnose reductase [Polynucleobacter sp. AP-Latsch-80-C2]